MKNYFLRYSRVAVVAVSSLGWSLIALASSFIVKDIRVEGLQRIEPGTVFAYLPIKAGDDMTDEKSAQAIQALYATGFFNDVKLEKQNNVLIVRVVERPSIVSVNFLGIKEFDKDTLKKALAGVGIQEGNYFVRSQIERAEQELKQQYLSRGFYAAQVHTIVTPLERNRVGVQFDVTEGPKAEISRIEFVGNKVFPTSVLRDQIELGTPNWLSWYTKNDLYSKDKLLGDLERLRSFYMNRGYLDFNIDSSNVSMAPDKKSMYLTIALHEGEAYKISSVKLDGEMLGKKDAIQKLILLKAGDVFSQAKMQESSKAISALLSGYGYAFAAINVQPELDKEKHQAKLTFFINPNHRVYVRQINITGNTRTRDEVIRRELRQFEKAWFDGDKVKLSKDRINRLGFFTNVDVSTEPVAGTRDEVDINVKVEEKKTGAFTIGLGLSSSGLMFQTGISEDNLFGSGQKLALNVNTAKDFRTATITHVDPYATVDGISRITNAYYSTSQPLLLNSSNSTFQVVSVGGNLKYGVPFSEVDTVFFGAGFEHTKIDLGSSAPQAYTDFVSQYGAVSNNVPVTVGWARDERDSSLAPTNGQYRQVSLEAGTPAGNLYYYRAYYQQQYFYPVNPGLILSFNGELGYGHGYGDRAFPIIKNYYAGGIGSVRGYETNTLGPMSNGVSIGGASELIGNFEVTFPLRISGYDRTVRLFTFVDAGNVFAEGQPYQLNQLRYSYGVGLSWLSPIGPLKLSFGLPFVKKAGDQYQRFQFQMGTAF